MPAFHYKAFRSDGTVIESQTVGETALAVRTQLERQGLLVSTLQAARTEARLSVGLQWGLSRTLSLRDFLIFNQQFLALLKAGLPILRVCELLAQRTAHPRFQAALHAIRQDIRGGASISEAMARYPGHFSELYRATLRSGEHTGALPDVLQRYVAYLKLVIAVREKVVKALAYPVFLVVVGVAVVAFLLTYVMPTFVDIYAQSNRELPAATQLLLTVVNHVGVWVPWAVGGLILSGVAGVQWIRHPKGREQCDRLLLALPVLGPVLLKNEIIRMTRTLSTILAGGIPLLHALEITAGAMTNRVCITALKRATGRVRDGVSLAAALRPEGILPPMMLEMVEVGETTGALESLLRDVAEFQEGELDLRLTQLTTWLEPVLLLVMGVLVGGLVVIMYLPVFEMAGAV